MGSREKRERVCTFDLANVVSNCEFHLFFVESLVGCGFCGGFSWDLGLALVEALR